MTVHHSFKTKNILKSQLKSKAIVCCDQADEFRRGRLRISAATEQKLNSYSINTA